MGKPGRRNATVITDSPKNNSAIINPISINFKSHPSGIGHYHINISVRSGSSPCNSTENLIQDITHNHMSI